MSLAATHSPTELRIWVLTRDYTGLEWGFTRWLPHTFNGDHGCSIATDGLGWAAAVKSIKQLIDTVPSSTSTGRCRSTSSSSTARTCWRPASWPTSWRTDRSVGSSG